MLKWYRRSKSSIRDIMTMIFFFTALLTTYCSLTFSCLCRTFSIFNVHFPVYLLTNIHGGRSLLTKNCLISECLIKFRFCLVRVAALFNCTPVDRASDSMMAPTLSYSFKLVGTGAFVCCLVHRGSTDYLLLLQIFSGIG